MPDNEEEPLLCEVRTLLEENRQRCAWFLRPDFSPHNTEEALISLRAIVRRCDRATYIRAEELRRHFAEPRA